MDSTDRLRRTKQSRRIMLGVHAAVVAIALLILLAYMLALILVSFNIGMGLGLRSIAATVLPFTVITYIGRFTNFFQMRRRMPVFNLFFIFTLWSIFLLAFTARLYSLEFPLGELLFSITLAATIWRYGPRSFNAFLSCCYGILTGTIIYIIFGGLPIFTQ